MIWVVDVLLNALRLARNVLTRLPGPPLDYVVVELSGSYPERTPAPRPLRQRLLAGPWQRPEESLEALRDRLERIAAAPHVRGIILRVRNLHAGWATLQSLRAALAGVRRRGKRVVAYLPEAPLATYYLAAAADEIWMPPAAFWTATGVRADITFFRQAFDRLGVLPEFERIAEFKTAADRFMRSGLSESHREMIESILDSILAAFTTDVAASRGLDPADVRTAIDRAPLEAGEAHAARLIDGVAYEDELPARLGSKERPATLEPWLAARWRLPLPYRWRAKAALVGVVELRGAIVPGESRELPAPLPLLGSRLAGSDTIARAFRAAERIRGIRAIVFHVDSGGGSALASDLIWREVERVKGVKPVVVFMGDTAGSGGYYVACGANRIVAQPGTITGSIGVVSGKMSVQRLFERLGLNHEIVARGEAATLDSPFRPFTPEQLERLRRETQTIYRRFIGVVAAGRGKKETEVDAIGRGRVWTGRQALERGLVDELGDCSLAIQRAAELAVVPSTQPVLAVTIHPPQVASTPSASPAAISEMVIAGGAAGALAGALEGLRAAWALARERALLLMPDPLPDPPNDLDV